MSTFKLLDEQTVQRQEDGACMPLSHPIFQKWVAAGHTPLPADPAPEPEQPRDLAAEIDAIKAKIGMK